MKAQKKLEEAVKPKRKYRKKIKGWVMSHMICTKTTNALLMLNTYGQTSHSLTRESLLRLDQPPTQVQYQADVHVKRDLNIILKPTPDGLISVVSPFSNITQHTLFCIL